jgi:hypothetical protein
MFDGKIFFANFQKLLTKLLGIFIISSFADNSKTSVGGFLTRNNEQPELADDPPGLFIQIS